MYNLEKYVHDQKPFIISEYKNSEYKLLLLIKCFRRTINNSVKT